MTALNLQLSGVLLEKVGALLAGSDDSEKISLALKDLHPPAPDTWELAFTEALNALLPQEGSVKKISALLDLSFAANEIGLVKDMSMELLEAAFDCLTLDLCEELFDFLKARAAKFTKDMVPNKGKALTLLRLSNEILRRLSNSRHTVFCGKIRIFLANSFPLCERSGVNVTGAFNLENETPIDPPEIMSERFAEAMDTSEDVTLIDHDFYQTFWSVQKFFVNPKLAQDPAQWTMFCNITDKILGAFDTFQESKQAAVAREFFYPKSLSSWKLFHLQLNDSSFRNHLLVQYIILFEYLSTFAPKAPVTGAKPAAKPVFVLNEKQEEHIKASTEKIFAILKKNSPTGDKFVETLKFCIKCDNIWVAWKAEGCPDFERKPLQGEPARKKQKTETASDETLKAWLSGKEDLSVIRDNTKFQPPTISGFLERIRKEMKPENDMEKQYRGSADQVYTWRAFRLMSQQFLEKFKDIAQVDVEGGIKLPDLEKFVTVISQTPATPAPTAAEAKQAEKGETSGPQSSEKADNPPSREHTPSQDNPQAERQESESTPKRSEEPKGMDVDEAESRGDEPESRQEPSENGDADGNGEGDDDGDRDRDREGEGDRDRDRDSEADMPQSRDEESRSRDEESRNPDEEDQGSEGGNRVDEEEAEAVESKKANEEEEEEEDDGSRRSRANRERRNTETNESEEGELTG